MTTIAFETITSHFSKEIQKTSIQNGQWVLWIDSAQLHYVLSQLKTHFGFEALLDIVAVDWQNKNENRYELIYLLYHFSNQKRLHVRVALNENQPEIQTVSDLYPSANWQERECFDMMGVIFTNHPNLKRLLMWNDFIGYPLRKDYPLNHRQPIPIQEDIV